MDTRILFVSFSSRITVLERYHSVSLSLPPGHVLKCVDMKDCVKTCQNQSFILSRCVRTAILPIRHGLQVAFIRALRLSSELLCHTRSGQLFIQRVTGSVHATTLHACLYSTRLSDRVHRHSKSHAKSNPIHKLYPI